MAQFMFESMHQSGDVEGAFAALTHCVKNLLPKDDAYLALCAANAKRLALQFPQRFQRDFDELFQRLPPKTQTFVSSVVQ